MLHLSISEVSGERFRNDEKRTLENDSARLAALDGRDEDIMMAIYGDFYHRLSAKFCVG